MTIFLSLIEIPPILISPLEILTNPAIDFKIVLLPDKPLPIKQTDLFGETSNEIFDKICFCSKSTLTFPDSSEDFAYDVSLDKVSSFNYMIFENELIDNAGKRLGVYNFPGVNNQSKVWTAKSGSGGPAVTNVAKLGANRFIKATDIDISKNFTISFWFKNIFSNLRFFTSLVIVYHPR